MSEQPQIRLRLFGLRGATMTRFEEQGFPFSVGLTVAHIWSELQRTAEPQTVLARLPRNAAHVFVNGVPIQRRADWDTPVAAGDTVTFMVMAAGGQSARPPLSNEAHVPEMRERTRSAKEVIAPHSRRP